jgi:hypothetical protein
LLHLLIGWITLEVALGRSSKPADQSGALSELAGNAAGRVVLWVAVLGFLALGVWQAADTVLARGTDSREIWTNRAKSLGKCAVYLALSWTALSFARGQARNSRSQTVDFTATVMGKPGGQGLVIAIGLGIVGVGIYHVHKGWTKRFLRDLEDHPGTWAMRAGRFGYVAKGIALGIVGVLFVAAGMHRSPGEASGLDGALRTLRDKPFGTGLLVAMAVGFAAYGVYSFSRARHARV